MEPVTNYIDTTPKASGRSRHVTKNDRKENDDRDDRTRALMSLYRWKYAFQLQLRFQIEEQCSVKQDAALASAAISDNG